MSANSPSGTIELAAPRRKFVANSGSRFAVAGCCGLLGLQIWCCVRILALRGKPSHSDAAIVEVYSYLFLGIPLLAMILESKTARRTALAVVFTILQSIPRSLSAAVLATPRPHYLDVPNAVLVYLLETPLMLLVCVGILSLPGWMRSVCENVQRGTRI